ncbi:MAG: YdcF family protein [Candidatus Omnitrophota bacterium]|nr:MAG: YdcF family protein [Candidatus Omnitrophota bacterium]
MLKNKNIICVSSIDWDFLWQGHQEIMSVLARNGNRVLFVENTGVRVPSFRDLPRLRSRFLNWKRGFKGIRKENENLYIYSPLVLPFPYSKIATKINRFIMLSVIKKWMRILEFHNPVVWSFLPTDLVLDILNELESSIFIYYCIDDFVSSSKGARKIRHAEEKVIKRADLVFTTSHKLYDRCNSINKETHLFPFGVSIDGYNRAREDKTIEEPHEMRRIKSFSYRVGYVGGIHKWIDLDLLKRIALKHPGIPIVLVGPEQVDLSVLKGIKNIHILGKKKKEELPNYVKFFNIGIIPYLKTDYTDNVYPTKINEYLAMGKPVISTKIPEVLVLDREQGGNFINFIENENDFLEAYKKARPDIITKAILEKRVAVANSNSWAAKIENMSDLIEAKLAVLQSRVNREWLSKLKKFYFISRRRAIKIALSASILYFLLFYTQFLWWVANPLKISQAPQKADAIVVFGGGVGEKGSPGKSTIERAIFSAELYNKGFARRVIYSSGFTWKYNDAENMKLIAMSKGVSEKDIILDKKGDFTYTNVKYTTEILRKNNFNKIILVSSPYNMRRASLVYNNIAKDIDVIYVPVELPQFYYPHNPYPIRLEQIKAILHEYGGIVYYFFKGYIRQSL